MRAFLPKGSVRPIVTSDNKSLRPYRQEVALMAKAAMAEAGEAMIPAHVPVTARFSFYLAKPASVPKKRWAHVVRPDLSKLLRATEDALTGIVFHDDAQIISCAIEKLYGLPERVEIHIETVDSEPKED